MSIDPGEEPSIELPDVVPFQGGTDAWNAIVAGLGDSTFCHLGGWRDVLADTFGHATFFWLAVDAAGDPVGALPLARVRSRLFGDYLLSMPFLSYGGPIGTDPARQALAEHAVRQASELGVDLLELRSRTRFPGDLSVSDRKVTVLLDLPETSELLWEKGIKSKLRSQVRRPMKEGMTARFGNDLVEPFYEVFSLTMRDLGTPVLPISFFEAIARAFPEQVVFSLVDHGSEVAAAACGFLWDGEFEITWAGARRDLNRLSPNMLLYWSLMEESIRRRAHTFNFGRCTPESGTHRFKKQWGGRDVPLPWAQSSPSGVIATPNPDSPKFRLATKVWTRLPVGVANRLGPMVSRSLP